MWAVIWTALVAIFKGVGAYLEYRFNPEMVKRRDEINKKAALESGLNDISQIFADKDNLKLSFFVSEFLRRKDSNSAPGWAADLQNRKLPGKRDTKDREADPQEGFDDG